MEKEKFIQFTVSKRIRIAKAMDELLQAKALENHTSESEIIRQALSSYFNRSLSDNEIFHASLNDIKRRIMYLERKIRLYPAMMSQMTKEMFTVLPDIPAHTEEDIDDKMDDFYKKVAAVASSHKEGVLESVILDIYENSPEVAE